MCPETGLARVSANHFDEIVATVVNLPFSASIFPTVFLPILLFHAALMIDVREIAQDTAPILALRVYQHLSEQALAVAALD
jgi:monovalent cation:H+ antiporter, CPA1 family